MKKKLQFLFSVVSLFCFALTVNAQFTDGKYYLQNVESGRYLGAGNAWGTQASLLKNPDYVTLISNEDGTYKIESQVANGSLIYFGEGYMDNGNPYSLTIEASGDYYTIADGENYFGYDGTSTVLGSGLAADSPNALWKIISEADQHASLANATATAPVDATFLITDHTFGRNHRYVNAWTNEGNAALTGGNSNKHCAEKYHGAYNVYQTIANAPKGVYKLTAQGFYRQDGSDNEHLPVVYAQTETALFPVKTGTENSMADACTSFENGLYPIDPIYVELEEAGDLVVGTKLEDNTNLWVIWDNFELTYYGAEASLAEVKFSGLIAQVDALRAQAEELKANEAVPATAVAALETALAESETIDATEEAYKTAIASLQTSVDAANVFVKASAILDKMKALVDETNVYTAEAYEEYYGQWVTKLEEGTITAEEVQALQDPSLGTGWHAAITVDNFLLSAWDTNPDFQDAPYYINTWSTEGDTDGSNFRVPFFEYWTGDGESLGEKTLTATITGLTPGNYAVKALARVRVKNGQTISEENPVTGITFVANEGEAVSVTDGAQVGTSQFYIKEVEATGTVAEDGILKIQFVVAAANNVSWLSFKNVKFEEIVEPVVVDLTQALYHKWTSSAADAEIAAEDNPYCLFELGVAAGNNYGDSGVHADQYADLTEYDYLTLVVSEGTPRLLLNRPTDDSQEYINLPNDVEQSAKYIKSTDNGNFIYDLAAIKADYGFVHLNAIKGANWGNVTINEMKLATVEPYVYVAPATYAITVAETENGTVEADVESAEENAVVTLTATPAEGFKLAELSVSYTNADEEVVPVELTEENTFVMPAAPVTVTATFEVLPEVDRSALDAEIEIAESLGVSAEILDVLKGVVAAEEIDNAVNSLKVAEYEAATANYTQNAAALIPDFANWEGGMVSNKGQHWDGTGSSTYYEQTGAQWGQDSWTNNKTTTVTLPKGKYVLFAAGRASAGEACTAYIKVGDVKRVYTSKGDVGLGINTAGKASFDAEDTFANNNLGRGFEYRYVAFEVTADEGEEITLEIGGEATAAHQWMSFTAPVLLTTEDNAAIAKVLLATAIDAAKQTIEAKAGVGEGLFLIPESAVATYQTAVDAQQDVYDNADATVAEVQAAVAALDAAKAAYLASATAPVAGTAYAVANTTAEGNLAIADNGVKVLANAAVYFTAVEGGYVISNEAGEYVFKTTANTWTFEATSNIEEAYVVNVNVVEGGYTIQGANGLFGLDGVAEGSTVYANKTADKNGVWTIEEFKVDAINGVAEQSKKANGKYFENGSVVIYKGGKKFNVAGVELK